MKIQIYYHQTDCGGVVYYAKYLEFLEEARTEFFEENGLPLTDLYKGGVFFVVARQEIDYKAPAHYLDVLDISTWIEDVSNVRVNFGYEIKNQAGKVIVRAKTIMVCVDKNLRPQAFPEEIKKRLEGLKVHGPK
ncbi:MAG: thioesterase family protein [Candidatus Omnitrophica bacterium]|nr:thioesterase family protein [Candidatus Omnitrophota bacterium]MDD5236063.1 thioesterase family protein [Candidatus Omnitrophota bacterium]MDD5609937.1 thioesterase family protein [Candidatus Omnitrophota bacterium]